MDRDQGISKLGRHAISGGHFVFHEPRQERSRAREAVTGPVHVVNEENIVRPRAGSVLVPATVVVELPGFAFRAAINCFSSLAVPVVI